MISAAAKRHTDLIAWQKAMNLVEEVYRMTKGFPKEELYGLANQVRRAVVSIPSNIAEVHGRTGPREFLHHLSIAHGSLSEVETQMEIASRLGFVSPEDRARFFEMSTESGRIINGLMTALERHINA